MDREIKFRAWHKKNQTMMTSYQAIKTIVGHFITDNPIKEDYILMQCTGEKDREGTEIYEGDILAYYYDDDEDVIDIYEVRFFNGCYIMSYGDYTAGLLAEFDIWYIKVIGNKYENPELLECKVVPKNSDIKELK